MSSISSKIYLKYLAWFFMATNKYFATLLELMFFEIHIHNL